jgi:hypothetical protein
MTIVSKAGLAAELGITKARVSQYVKRGLPVRSDGKLDREDAVNWVAQNHGNYGRTRAPGVNRAANIERASRAPAIPTPSHVIRSFATVIGGSGKTVRAAGFKLGLPAKTVWMLEQMISLDLSSVAETAVPALNAFEGTIDEGWKAGEAEWDSVAAEHGETYDGDAWWIELDEIRDNA